MQSELSRKDADIGKVAARATNDERLLHDLVQNLWEKEENVRYNSYLVLRQICEQDPELLYPCWDDFVAQLGSDNSYHKIAGLNLVAALTPVDKENRFEPIFDTYFSLMHDRSMIVANYLCLASGTIAKAKPALRQRITRILLDIDNTAQRHKDLIKGAALESFDQYFTDIENKEEVLAFARSLLKGESPKTRKLAKQFLEKWENQ